MTNPTNQPNGTHSVTDVSVECLDGIDSAFTRAVQGLRNWEDTLQSNEGYEYQCRLPFAALLHQMLLSSLDEDELKALTAILDISGKG